MNDAPIRPDTSAATDQPEADSPALALEDAKTKVGGGHALCRLLGLSLSAVAQWNGKVPPGRVLAVEAATGVPRWRLRPDLYPREAAAPAVQGAAA